MKPDWDKLIGEFAGSSTQLLIADVDCTADGKPLCEAAGVEGFPTLKWGDPADLQDYEGERTYDDLKKFTEENLKPLCSLKNLDLCDDDEKAEIVKFQGMSDTGLAAAIAAEEEKLEAVEEEFELETQKLEDRYTALSNLTPLIDTRKSVLGLMKAVKNSKPSGSDEL